MSEVINQPGGALALPNDVMAALAAEAKAAAANERPSTGRISLKSGQMTYGGAPIAGNKMEVLILSAAYRNVWYAGRYDANNVVNPNCFSLADTDADMVPHINVREKPAAACGACPHNEWGSDPNGGRGKACKQSRRLVLLPATALKDGREGILGAEMAVMDLPVTSVKNYSTFINTLAASANVPPYAAVTEVSVVPNAKTQFQVQFRPLRVVGTMEELNAVRSRLDAARTLSLEPYEDTAVMADEEEQTPAPAAAAAKKAKKF